MTTGRFSRARYINEARESAVATQLTDGRVLILGGDQGYTGRYASILASAEVFDPFSGRFNFTGSMNGARSHFNATLLKDGRVLVMGGVDLAGLAAPLATAELYDSNIGTWGKTGSMAVGRSDFTATRLDDGRVLVAGGGDQLGRTLRPLHRQFLLGSQYGYATGVADRHVAPGHASADGRREYRHPGRALLAVEAPRTSVRYGTLPT